jgi:uncharacterized protein (TIGR03067 family)
MGIATQLLTWTALASPALFTQEKEQPLDVKQLIGAYTLVSGENQGEKIPADRIRDHVAMISEDRIVVSDRDKKELYASTYQLDPERKGSAGGTVIQMTTKVGPEGSEGQRAVGLIKAEKGTVTLIYAYEGGEPPTEFKTKPDSKQNMFVLKKADLSR